MVLLVLILIAGGGAAVLAYLSYARFVRQSQLVTEAWRQVDVELRRRADLTAGAARQAASADELTRQLAESEDRIAAARRFYNANVRAYNTRLALLPGPIAARTNFTPARYFEVSDPAVRAPYRLE